MNSIRHSSLINRSRLIALVIFVFHSVAITEISRAVIIHGGESMVEAAAWAGDDPGSLPVGVPVGNPAYMTKNTSTPGRFATASITSSYTIMDDDIVFSGDLSVSAERTITDPDPTLVGAKVMLFSSYVSFSIVEPTVLTLQGNHNFPVNDYTWRLQFIVTGPSGFRLYDFDSAAGDEDLAFSSTLLIPGQYTMGAGAVLEEVVDGAGSFDLSSSFSITASFTPVPEPAAAALAALGLGALLLRRRGRAA